MPQGNHPDHPPVEGGYRGTVTTPRHINSEIDKVQLSIFLMRCAVLSGKKLDDVDWVFQNLLLETCCGYRWTRDNVRMLIEHLPAAAKAIADYYLMSIGELRGTTRDFSHEDIMRAVRGKTSYVGKQFNQLYNKFRYLRPDSC